MPGCWVRPGTRSVGAVCGQWSKSARGLLPACRKLVTDAKLAEHNLASVYETHQKRPLADHLEDFRSDLLAKGTTAKQVRLVCGRVRRLIDGCGFRFIPDLSAS